MGLKMTIYLAKTMPQETTQTNVILSFSHFWDLYYALESNIKNGDYLQLTNEHINKMIEFTTHHRDPQGSFNGVVQLCEIADKFKEQEEQGYHYWLSCKW